MNITFPQCRLLAPEDEQIKSDPNGNPVFKHSHIAEQQPLTKISNRTATYMGFLTGRNNPLTTKCCMGKIGAGVPRPWRAKRAKESRSSGRPAAIKSVPKTRKEEIPSNGASTMPSANPPKDVT
jgi:hypothetical protein